MKAEPSACFHDDDAEDQGCEAVRGVLDLYGQGSTSPMRSTWRAVDRASALSAWTTAASFAAPGAWDSQPGLWCRGKLVSRRGRHLVPADIAAVLRAWRIENLNTAKAGLGQHSPGRLLTPHRPEPCTSGRQRHRHAVHEAESVMHRGERVADVLFDQATELEIDHQESSSRR